MIVFLCTLHMVCLKLKDWAGYCTLMALFAIDKVPLLIDFDSYFVIEMHINLGKVAVWTDRFGRFDWVGQWMHSESMKCCEFVPFLIFSMWIRNNVRLSWLCHVLWLLWGRSEVGRLLVRALETVRSGHRGWMLCLYNLRDTEFIQCFRLLYINSTLLQDIGGKRVG